MNGFEGRVALITGGASGIGRALGEELARRGAVVELADRNAPLLAETVAVIVRTGATCAGTTVDVTDAEGVASWVAGAAKTHGRLDYIFNNAGIAIQADFHEHTLEHWNRTIDINLRGVLHGIHAAYPIMIAQGFGHIVNTASLAGLCPGPGLAAYTAAKHAVVGISTTLRGEAAGFGVRASVVCPGVIETPLVHTMTIVNEDKIPGGRAEVIRRVPFKFYTPQRCAEVILRGVERNRPIIVVTPHAKVLWRLYRLAPVLVLRIGTVIAERMRRELRGAAPPANRS